MSERLTWEEIVKKCEEVNRIITDDLPEEGNYI